MTALVRYWHTARHLRPVQIYGRVWHRLYRPRANARPAPPLAKPRDAWCPPVRRAPSMLGASDFRFLNVESSLRGALGWAVPGHTRLWLYNLHYFDDLNADDAESREDWHRALIDCWIVENPPGIGTGWEPYPLSLRITNWVKWALAGYLLEPDWRNSLAAQARFLCHRLEWHLLGNHLLANAKALIFAGCFFDGREADGWRRKGLRILEREIGEQVLPDGGHFELSPMYHGLVLEDLADLLNLARAFPGKIPDAIAGSLRETVGRMLVWQRAMLHPDGGIAFFNDAAFGIAPVAGDLEDYARRLGLEVPGAGGRMVSHLADSGYLRLERPAAVALLDVGRVGPEYLPGHAHADTLAFELSLFGSRLFVNSGTSEYGVGPERSRQRGTAAHNTVEVDSEDSSEVWHGFRVARRARPFGLAIDDDADAVTVRCSHDGYQRLPGRVTHQRTWTFGDTSLVVEDRLSGEWSTAVARYFLHPEIAAEADDGGVRFRLPGGQTVTGRISGGAARLVPGTWHPEFGRVLQGRCLEVALAGPVCQLSLAWEVPCTSSS